MIEIGQKWIEKSFWWNSLLLSSNGWLLRQSEWLFWCSVKGFTTKKTIWHHVLVIILTSFSQLSWKNVISIDMYSQALALNLLCLKNNPSYWYYYLESGFTWRIQFNPSGKPWVYQVHELFQYLPTHHIHSLPCLLGVFPKDRSVQVCDL